EEHRRIIDLVRAISFDPAVHVMVRRHPQEKTRNVHQIKNAGFVPTNISLTECALAADFVVSVNSTAMLEPALLRVPVVQIALPGFADRIGLLNFPRQIHDQASLLAMLRRLRDETERSACVEEQQELLDACLANRGSGTDATWRHIQNEIGKAR